MKYIVVPASLLLLLLTVGSTDVTFKQTTITTTSPKDAFVSLQNDLDRHPLDTGIIAKKLLEGKRLFMNQCASCHKPDKEFVGPMLAKCRQREPDKNWAYRFVSNTNVMLETDSYAKALLKKYGSRQPQFNGLTKKEVDAILDYCDSYRPPKLIK